MEQKNLQAKLALKAYLELLYRAVNAQPQPMHWKSNMGWIKEKVYVDGLKNLLTMWQSIETPAVAWSSGDMVTTVRWYITDEIVKFPMLFSAFARFMPACLLFGWTMDFGVLKTAAICRMRFTLAENEDVEWVPDWQILPIESKDITFLMINLVRNCLNKEMSCWGSPANKDTVRTAEEISSLTDAVSCFGPDYPYRSDIAKQFALSKLVSNPEGYLCWFYYWVGVLDRSTNTPNLSFILSSFLGKYKASDAKSVVTLCSLLRLILERKLVGHNTVKRSIVYYISKGGIGATKEMIFLNDAFCCYMIALSYNVSKIDSNHVHLRTRIPYCNMAMPAVHFLYYIHVSNKDLSYNMIGKLSKAYPLLFKLDYTDNAPILFRYIREAKIVLMIGNRGLLGPGVVCKNVLQFLHALHMRELMDRITAYGTFIGSLSLNDLAVNRKELSDLGFAITTCCSAGRLIRCLASVKAGLATSNNINAAIGDYEYKIKKLKAYHTSY